MLLRVREQIHMDNPQLDSANIRSCGRQHAPHDTVEMELALPHIPDSEAAYLAMHFWRGARAERCTAAGRPRGGCVPAGYELKSISGFAYRGRIPTLKVDGCCGARTRSEQLHSRGIDLVIATVPLELAYPSITVNPALLEPDRALLRDAVQWLNGTVRDRHTGRAVCRLDGRRRPALHLSPHALDGADARPFMHSDCVQTGFAAGLIDAASRLARMRTHRCLAAQQRADGSHGRYLYQAAVRAAAALQDKGGIGLPIRLFTGTAAGIRGRKDDYGGHLCCLRRIPMIRFRWRSCAW